MTVMERLANSIVVPVVVLDKVEDAVPTAKAMAAGGVDTMEITFRSACAQDDRCFGAYGTVRQIGIWHTESLSRFCRTGFFAI